MSLRSLHPRAFHPIASQIKRGQKGILSQNRPQRHLATGPNVVLRQIHGGDGLIQAQHACERFGLVILDHARVGLSDRSMEVTVSFLFRASQIINSRSLLYCKEGLISVMRLSVAATPSP